MKFKSLFTKNLEKPKDQKKKGAFKKMFIIGATTLTLMSCEGGSDLGHSDWGNTDNEITDTDTDYSRKTYCDPSILDKNFSTNVSLEKGENIYLFNRVKITFDNAKNQKFYFTAQPENFSTETIEMSKNRVIQIENNQQQYNILEICSYDVEKRIVNIASNEVFLPYIFKGSYDEITENKYENHEQIIQRSYYIIEGNAVTTNLLVQEKNWIFPPLNGFNDRTVIDFDNEQWLLGNLNSNKIILFKESAYYGGMPKNESINLENNISITFKSKITEEGINYAVFELEGNSTQRVIVPENEMLSVIFEGEKINLFVGKIYENSFESDHVCDLSIISKYIEFTSSGNKINYEIYGINITADVNFSNWENTTKLEMYPNYDFSDLVKRKEREE